MADNYSQFSEAIDEITPEEAAWIEKVLRLDAENDEEFGVLQTELGVRHNKAIEYWPDFEWALEGKDKSSLWLYSEEGFTEENLTLFVQAFLRKFRPKAVFKATGSCTCSRLRIGEFGGWWLAVSAKEVRGGNTWDAASQAAEEMRKSLGPKRKPRRAAPNRKARPRR